jgi:nucleotide-binding universal stress UspA family protein
MMFKHILIPIDAPQLSQHAAKVGLEFAQRLQAQVTLLHVLQMPPVYPPQSEHATLETIRDHAQKLLEPWPDLAATKGVSLKTKMVQDDAHSVAASIINAANSLECDLILMGTQGREGLERLLVGSVAERVTRLANQPVMLVRSVHSDHPSTVHSFESILVPIDGSTTSQAALWTADELAKQLGASLHFLHVIPDPPLPMGDGIGLGTMNDRSEPWIEMLKHQGQAIIKNAKESTTLEIVETSTIPASGARTAKRILKFAKEHHSSLIVIGTHGRSGLDRLLLGSVAEGVMHHSDVPVILVRAKPSKTSPGPNRSRGDTDLNTRSEHSN